MICAFLSNALQYNGRQKRLRLDALYQLLLPSFYAHIFLLPFAVPNL